MTKPKATIPSVCALCGSHFLAHAHNIRKGHGRYCSRSCASRFANRKHGHNLKGHQSPTYLSWQSMIARCSNQNAGNYGEYGGRGIGVCERWRDFRDFLADMGERPDNASLDRIDNDGNYEPGNCRWASAREQNQNTRKSLWVTINGERISAPDLERRMGFSRGIIAGRLAKGWREEDLLKPMRYQKALPQI